MGLLDQRQHGAEAFPVVKDGVIYVTSHNTTAAVDAITGKQLWRVTHDYPPETTARRLLRHRQSRRRDLRRHDHPRACWTTSVVALDAKTGKEIWKVKSPEPATIQNGYAMTGAPLIVERRVIIVGVAGAEFSHPRLPRRLRRRDRQASLARSTRCRRKGEPGSETWEGDSALTGGGSSWVTGTYDPELDLVYWGIGNPSPWNPRARKGDNLFTNSVFAVRPKTGERVWYYQTTPQDPFDYDAVQTPVIGTINVGGTPRKVVMQANRSGFLYVLDAKDGKLIAGQRVRQGELGRRRRHEDRTPDRDRRLHGRARGQERHGLAVGVGRDQLAAHVVQPADRDALHQHPACRHDLRGRRAAEAGARQAVRTPGPSSAPSCSTIPTFAATSRRSIR